MKKNYHKDLVYKCIKRLYFAEEMLAKYLVDVVREDEFLSCLDLEGYDSELRHPILDYTKNEKECFVSVCGVPLELPTNFANHSPESVRGMIIKQRNKLRRIAGMIDKSGWLGVKNYLCLSQRKKTYFTGRLIG